MENVSQKLVRIVSSLFFLSGFSALTYEVIWFKRFSHVWGNSTLSQAAVVSTFLFGLAVGAVFLGRLADRVKRPLAWYCGLELLIGVFAILIPYELLLLRQISAAVYPWAHSHPILQIGARFVLTLLVIGPPCVLMGGTLPMLMRNFLVCYPWFHETTGWLYAINTLGAAAGCYVAGFHLLPAVGILAGNWVAVFINLDVALIAYLLLRQMPVTESAAANESIDQAPLPVVNSTDFADIPRRRIFPAAALTGCASLILQMVWTRKLAVMLGGSTYVFSAILFVFLLGIGLGSLIYSRSVGRIRHISRTLTGVITLLILFSVLGTLLIPPLTMTVGTMRYLRSVPLLNAVISVSVSALLQLVPTICMGFLFPFFVDLLRGTSRNIGTLVGDIYTWNTAGSIVGVWLAPFVLIYFWGTAYTLAFAMLLYIGALLLVYPFSRERIRKPLAPALVLMALMTLIISRPINPLITDVGMFMDGYIPTEEANTMKNLYFKEGALANVLVTESDLTHSLRVNGKVDASDQGDMNMQLGLAYFPRFFRPESKNVIVIGYGSGTTAGASLLFPETRVTCCEIEPAIVGASDIFGHVNHRPTRSLNFNLVLDDGRSYLEGSPETYDLILSEPSNPWMAGVSNLFTLDFYKQVKNHLTPTGIFTQWIQTYTISSDEYTTIIRTLMQVFPQVGMIRISGGDTLLLASDTPLMPEEAVLRKSQAMVDTTPEIRRDLEIFFQTADIKTLMMLCYVLPQEDLQKAVEAKNTNQINTDMNMRLEYDAPLYLFLASEVMENVDKYMLTHMNPQWMVECFKTWNCSEPQLKALKSMIWMFAEYSLDDKRRRLLEFALQQNPDDPYLLSYSLMDMTVQTPEFAGSVRHVAEASPEDAYQIGYRLARQEKMEEAAAIYDALVNAKPSWTSAWINLAACNASLRRWEPAEKALEHAKLLDPTHPVLKRAKEEITVMKVQKNASIKPAPILIPADNSPGVLLSTD